MSEQPPTSKTTGHQAKPHERPPAGSRVVTTGRLGALEHPGTAQAARFVASLEAGTEATLVGPWPGPLGEQGWDHLEARVEVDGEMQTVAIPAGPEHYQRLEADRG